MMRSSAAIRFVDSHSSVNSQSRWEGGKSMPEPESNPGLPRLLLEPPKTPVDLRLNRTTQITRPRLGTSVINKDNQDSLFTGELRGRPYVARALD
jgi:hypothetical protein